MMKTALVGNTQLVAGTPETIADILLLLKEMGIEAHANPDVYVRVYRQFGVEEARELRERASLKPLGERRVFLIVSASMTHEAQNALLKTLEEPGGNPLFFFVVPSPETLLPTLRSRAQVLALETHKKKHEMVDIDRFLGASPEKRLELLAPLLEKGEDEKRDTAAILHFFSLVEERLGKTISVSGLHALYRARKYIADRGALVKPLLEQMALLVPKL